MKTLFDRASMERALTLDLDPKLRPLLKRRIEALVTEDPVLCDLSEIVVFEAGDGEDDLVREVGFSPLENPIDGARFGSEAFQPYWSWLQAHDGYYELIETIGNDGFAFILFIQDAEGVDPQLLALCRRYAGQQTCG